MNRKILLIAACIIYTSAQAQIKKTEQPGPWDSLAMTPPMGWNSWNFFEGKISEKVVMNMADAMSANGMKDAGYSYLVIDDLWVGGRDRQNRLYPDTARFPGGMKFLADYVHHKGLKLGIYSDAAELTCGGVTGSLGFEELDAKTWADWGIDFVKYDYCNAPADVATAFLRYKKMGDAIRNSGRPMVFAICEWGQRKPWLWARAAGAQMWRTTWDSRDVWQSNNQNLTGIMEIYNRQRGLERYAGQGGWNDPDLLMVGLSGKGSSSSVEGRFKGCTATEYRTHFALWCMLAAPLMLNMDLTGADKLTLDLITNKAMISIDQDSLGEQASVVYDKNEIQVLVKRMTMGRLAVCVFNKRDALRPYAIDLKKDLDIWKPFQVQAVWNNKSLGRASGLSGSLPAHGCEVFIFN